MIEAVLVTLALIAIGAGLAWIVRKILIDRRMRQEDEALAEVLRRRALGEDETEMPDELLERAERAQRRLEGR